MSFDKPIILAFLLALPLLALALFFHYRRFRREIRFFVDLSRGSFQHLGLRYGFSVFFFILFIACMILSLSGPRQGFVLRREERRGVDTVLAMDVSRSMACRDTSPSRLERGTAIAGSIIESAPGIRFALAVGRGKAVLALPLTEDREALFGYLDQISPDSISGGGSNLEALLDAAGGAFVDTFPSKRRIILFTDGEELSGALEKSLQRLNERDITVIAVALGTEKGAPVPAGDGFLHDESGKEVISRLRLEALEKTAEHTGGMVIDGNEDNAASLLQKQIQTLTEEGAYRRERRPWWRLFCAAGLCCLFLSRLITLQWKKKTIPAEEPLSPP